MWSIRFHAILVLAVACTLPPGLFRDCCCTRKVSVETKQTIPVRACCQAKLTKRGASIPQKKAGSGLQRPQCQCQHQLTTSAILVSDQRVAAGSSVLTSDLSLSPLPSFHVESIRERRPSRSRHYLDPPLRKTLCRWVI